MGERKISNPVVAAVADVIGNHYYSHTRLNTLFAESGAPGDPPDGNCVKKCEQWLKRCDADPSYTFASECPGTLSAQARDGYKPDAERFDMYEYVVAAGSASLPVVGNWPPAY